MDTSLGTTPTNHQVTSALQASKRRLLRNHQSTLYWLQLSIDLIIINSLLVIFCLYKFDNVPMEYRLLAIISSLVCVLVYWGNGVYRQSRSDIECVARVFASWVIVSGLILVLGFVTKTTEIFSREVMLYWFVTAGVCQAIARLVTQRCVAKLRKVWAKPTNCVVIGLGATARELAHKLNNNPWLPDQVVGMVNGSEEAISHELEDRQELPLLGDLTELKTILELHNIKKVYVALPMRLATMVEELNVELLDAHVDIIWVPDMSALRLLNHSIKEVGGLPLISLNESPMTCSRVSMRIKSFVDKILAGMGIIVLSPVLLSIAVLVKRSSPGSIIFKQKRHGFDGRVIEVWKFRSMKPHDETDVVQQATKSDDRITPIGRFIRRTSIDELPQLFNVLQGRMSLVGPRPHAVSHNEFYSDKINAYLARHRIKPGITGLAQISGARGETETLDKMQKRIDFDLEYINNWSLWLDIKILIKTPLSLLAKDIY